MPITTPQSIFIDSSKKSLPVDEVQQSYPYDCAVRSQQIVLRDFGIRLSEDDLCNEARSNGWYGDDYGTTIEDVGNLLEAHGVEVQHFDCANQYTLAAELSQGHRVIVAVDADELWTGGPLTDLRDLLMGQTPNHALIVSGLDYSDPSHPSVVVTDPGTGEPFRSYPMDQFLDAWADSNYHLVSTINPAPAEFNPNMANFDYSVGHIENIGGGYGAWDDFISAFGHMLTPVIGQFLDTENDISGLAIDESAITDAGVCIGSEVFDFVNYDV